jgi:hypothetical protein
MSDATGTWWTKLRPIYRRARKVPPILRSVVGVVLVLAGFVGIIMPILGFWMVPLGLVFIALDIPPLRGFLERKIELGIS